MTNIDTTLAAAASAARATRDAAYSAFEASLSRNDDLAVTDALHDDLIRAAAAYDAARARAAYADAYGAALDEYRAAAETAYRAALADAYAAADRVACAAAANAALAR
jgi:hypothetical protein